MYKHQCLTYVKLSVTEYNELKEQNSEYLVVLLDNT